jgi:hypothetical protein
MKSRQQERVSQVTPEARADVLVGSEPPPVVGAGDCSWLNQSVSQLQSSSAFAWRQLMRI